MALEDWDEVCSALGAWEARHLAGDQTNASLEEHRTWVTQLLAWVQLLQRVTEHSAFFDHAAANPDEFISRGPEACPPTATPAER